nr:hypothetical protein FEE99_06530 [Pseudomonas sp. ef1]
MFYWPGYSQEPDRSHAQHRNVSTDAPRSALKERGASRAAFPRRAWERSASQDQKNPNGLMS